MDEEAFISTTELLKMENDKRCSSYNSEVLPVDNIATVSSRGKAALSPSLPYIKSFYKCLNDPIHPVTNPSGYIALCVAESKLECKKLLAERLSRPSVGREVFLDDDAYNYGDFRGLFKVRQVIAQFLEEFFFQKTSLSDGIIDPNHICIGSGASSVLGHLFYALAERREAVLIPAPYYNAFENDMKQIAGCVPIPVYMKDCTLGPTVEELEEAALLAEQQGLTVKILLITNPNNPLGVIYSPTTVLHAVEWARKRKMHTIVDELYALSIHDKRNESFVSIIRILNNSLGNDVHFLWALSKDLVSSGFRVGILYSQNMDLISAIQGLSLFSCVPFPMQLITMDLLKDHEFLVRFLEHSRQNIVHSKAVCTEKLQQLSLPYVEAEAGIFLYVNFASLLPPDCTFDHEAKFAWLMENTARLVMTPGQSQRDHRPGWFRICYAWVSVEVLNIAMCRIEFVVNYLRTIGNNWYDTPQMLDYNFLNNVLLLKGADDCALRN